jgi:hypothetical protein
MQLPYCTRMRAWSKNWMHWRQSMVNCTSHWQIDSLQSLPKSLDKEVIHPQGIQSHPRQHQL